MNRSRISDKPEQGRDAGVRWPCRPSDGFQSTRASLFGMPDPAEHSNRNDGFATASQISASGRKYQLALSPSGLRCRSAVNGDRVPGLEREAVLCRAHLRMTVDGLRCRPGGQPRVTPFSLDRTLTAIRPTSAAGRDSQFASNPGSGPWLCPESKERCRRAWRSRADPNQASDRRNCHPYGSRIQVSALAPYAGQPGLLLDR